MREYVKSVICTLLQYLMTMVAAAAIGTLLLTLSYCIPMNEETKASSLEYADQMGWDPLVNKRYSQYQPYFTSYEVGIINDSTDKIILNNCFSEDATKNALERALTMGGYSIYWHGYASILKPIFYFMDYFDFLLLNSFLQFIVMGCVGFAIYKVTKKLRYLLAFACSCVFLTPVACAMSLQNTLVFYVAMLGTLFCLVKTDWILKKNRRFWIFLVIGIITNYLDFLTFPLLSFGLPFCFLLIAAGDRLDFGSRIRMLFGSGVSFIVGWAGFFIMKWKTLSLLLGIRISSQGASIVNFFLFGGLDDETSLLHQTYNRIDTIYNNFRHYEYPFFALLICAWIVFFLWQYLTGALKIKRIHLIFLAVTLFAPVWYCVMYWHSTCHHLFTFRDLNVSILGFMLFICECMGEPVSLHKIPIKPFCKRLAIVVVCFLVGLLSSRLAMQDYFSIYGADHQELTFAADDVMEVGLTPPGEKIKSFSLMFDTAKDVEGTMLIELYDGDTLCHSMEVPISDYINSAYVAQYVDWNVERGKEYRLRMTLKGKNTDITLLVTHAGEKHQAEYGTMYVNGEELTGVSPLSGITYRGYFQSKPIKLYLSLCMSAFVLMWVLGIYTLTQGNMCHFKFYRKQ